MTARRRSVLAVREVMPLRFEDHDNVHVVVVECPWCGAEHEHVAPRAPVAGAELERMPRCMGRGRLLRILLTEPAGALS